MMIDSTEAKMGRLMKKLENIRRDFGFWILDFGFDQSLLRLLALVFGSAVLCRARAVRAGFDSRMNRRRDGRRFAIRRALRDARHAGGAGLQPAEKESQPQQIERDIA